MKTFYISKYPPNIYRVTSNSPITKKGAIIITISDKKYYIYKPFWHDTLEEAQKEIVNQLISQRTNLENNIKDIDNLLNSVFNITDDPLPIIQRGGGNSSDDTSK